MIELENPQIEPVGEPQESYAKYEASPLPAGYGVTISYAPHPVQLRLLKSGAGVVTANDIEPNADIEIVNPDQELLTLDSDDMPVEIDMTVERGVGYLAAERSDQLPIGVIPVDAIFSPVRKVNYTVENTRVGQMTNFD